MKTGHPTQFEQHRGPTQGPRFVSLQLESVDEIAQQLTAAGATVDVPLRDELWGQRHIVVEDLGGNLVDLISAIDPDPQFAATWWA